MPVFATPPGYSIQRDPGSICTTSHRSQEHGGEAHAFRTSRNAGGRGAIRPALGVAEPTDVLGNGGVALAVEELSWNGGRVK